MATATQPKLTAPAETVAESVSVRTGLDINVVRAWIAQESDYGRRPSAAFNFLNLRGANNHWAEFSSPEAAANAFVSQLQRAPHWYGGILASAHHPAKDQIAAIAASPWSGQHYGGTGGPNLLRTYNTVLGSYGGTAAGPSLLSQIGHALLLGTPAGVGIAAAGGLGTTPKALIPHIDVTGWVLDLGLILLAGGLVLVGSKQLFDKQVGPLPGVPV